MQIPDETVPVVYKDVVKIKATNPDSYKQWIRAMQEEIKSLQD